MSDSKPVALVTAAGRGIGAACALELSRRGYHLALLSPSGAPDVAAETGAVAVAGSVTDTDDLRTLVDGAMERWGRIDAVVANTGHPAKGELLELTDEDWHDALDLVLLYSVRLARLVTPIMRRQGGGAILNITTLGAAEPNLMFPISSALRSAVGAFTKLYADRYGADGIRMNALLPGFADSYPESDDIIAKIPMGRYATVAEVARTIAFLVSDDSSYVTGQSIRIDGALGRSF
ncbi:MAG: SDR family oxidoreductase [Acidobacteriota bacterium]